MKLHTKLLLVDITTTLLIGLLFLWACGMPEVFGTIMIVGIILSIIQYKTVDNNISL